MEADAVELRKENRALREVVAAYKDQEAKVCVFVSMCVCARAYMIKT
jgi:hypothetical protein